MLLQLVQVHTNGFFSHLNMFCMWNSEAKLCWMWHHKQDASEFRIRLLTSYSLLFLMCKDEMTNDWLSFDGG